MTTPSDIFQTVVAWMVVCPVEPIFGHIPSDDDMASFLSEMLNVLSQENHVPDAAGVNLVEGKVYFAYRGLVEASAVREAIYVAYKEAQKLAAREARRRKMLGKLTKKTVWDKDRFVESKQE